MLRKRHTPEEIVGKLRQVNVMLWRGLSMAEAIDAIGISEQCYYRWRSRYGGTGLTASHPSRTRRDEMPVIAARQPRQYSTG